MVREGSTYVSIISPILQKNTRLPRGTRQDGTRRDETSDSGTRERFDPGDDFVKRGARSRVGNGGLRLSDRPSHVAILPSSNRARRARGRRRRRRQIAPRAIGDARERDSSLSPIAARFPPSLVLVKQTRETLEKHRSFRVERARKQLHSLKEGARARTFTKQLIGCAIARRPVA